jgi:hypothetical protein
VQAVGGEFGGRDVVAQVAVAGSLADQVGDEAAQVVLGSDGKEYLAASDRDLGLYIFRYTGTD